MTRSSTQTVVAVADTSIVLTAAARWLHGVSPYAQFLKLVCSGILIQVVPVELVEGASVAFFARIIQCSIDGLSLLVYSDDDEQRVGVDGFMGGPVGRPGNVTRRSENLRTVVLIFVRDPENRIVNDRTAQSDGRIVTTSADLGLQLDMIEIGEGIHGIGVAPLRGMASLAPFRSAIETYYLFK